MKTQSMLLASLAAIALSASRGAAADVSVSVFYDALEPTVSGSSIGLWLCMDSQGSGRRLAPIHGTGMWAYTDAGWTWVSEEPYAWAVYHYGRWANIERVVGRGFLTRNGVPLGFLAP
jgi:hypothetical protein